MDTEFHLELNDNYTGIENRLVEIESETGNINIAGTFVYFTFQGKTPTVKEFVDFIYFKMTAFCIPQETRQRHHNKYLETGDLRYMVELTDQAKGLFMRSQKELIRGGEPAELILFTILEGILGARKIASKMYLKTSQAMPIHGSDGIHAKYIPDSNTLNLYWGESKLYQSLSGSLDRICESIEGFIGDPGNTSPKDRDVQILKDHTDVQDIETRNALLNFFDPYSPESNNLREVYCCFSGFDYSVYGSLNDKSEEEIEQYFREKYIERIASACKLFSGKLKDQNLDQLKIQFILLPFPDVSEFRKLFFKKLGIEKYITDAEQ